MPILTGIGQNGTAIAINDNWQEEVNFFGVQGNGLAPSDLSESALVLNLPSGSYTVRVSGAGGATGVALLEAYNLN